MYFLLFRSCCHVCTDTSNYLNYKIISEIESAACVPLLPFAMEQPIWRIFILNQFQTLLIGMSSLRSFSCDLFHTLNTNTT